MTPCVAKILVFSFLGFGAAAAPDRCAGAEAGQCTQAELLAMIQTTVVREEADPKDCCGEVPTWVNDPATTEKLGAFSVAFGNQHGSCCVIEKGLPQNAPIPVASLSKWVTGYVILALADEGLFTLETKVAEILDWWSAKDERADVTVRHLLAQTDGLQMFYTGFANCTAPDIDGCSKEAYNHHSGVKAGTDFSYTETSFFVLGSIALKVTGLDTYNDVFRKYIADPLKMSNACGFTYPTLANSDPGGFLICTMQDYIKFLHAVYARTLVSPELAAEADKPQTIGALNDVWGLPGKKDPMPVADPFGTSCDNLYSHYGLGHWVDVTLEEPPEVIRQHSIGMFGSYPWMDATHWGVMWRLSMDYVSNNALACFATQNLLPKVKTSVASAEAS